MQTASVKDRSLISKWFAWTCGRNQIGSSIDEALDFFIPYGI
jgi:hypothetical protein